jgi:hypothetical protein
MVRYVGEFPVIAGGLLWMPGEAKEVDERTGHELLTNPNFVHADAEDTGTAEGDGR